MIQAILDNPAILDVLITAIAFVAAWAFRKGLKLVDSRWATEHLTGLGLHAGHAAEAALRVYQDEIDKADEEDSDGGKTVTDKERKSARDAARDRFLDEIGVGQLRKALGISRGQAVSEKDAARFATEMVDNAVESARPFVSGSIASNADQ